MSHLDTSDLLIHAQPDGNGVWHADTREFVRVLEQTPGDATIVVCIGRDVPCTLAYATVMYGILVEKEQHTRDLVLRLADVPQPAEFVPVTRIGRENGGRDFVVGGYRAVAVGGTFDRLHAGHRLLLTVAAWTATENVYIGVTAQAMLLRKQYRELIQPFATRADEAVRFVKRVNPGLSSVQASPLNDGAGIAGRLERLDALVATSETSKGAAAVNELRKGRDLQPLHIVVVHLLFASSNKLSSTALRAKEAGVEQ